MAAFEAQLEGVSELRLRFERMPAAVRARLPQTMRDVCQIVAAQARANIARMFRNPQKMQDSISVTVEEGPVNVRGTVMASGLPYLAIQEYGGVVQIPEITPVKAQALHWLGNVLAQANPTIFQHKLGFAGERSLDDVFAMRARAHEVRIPERSYMRAALAQKQREVIAEFEKQLQEEVSKV